MVKTVQKPEPEPNTDFSEHQVSLPRPSQSRARETGIVAARRSLLGPDQSGRTRIVGYDKTTGKPLECPVLVPILEGQAYTDTPEEIARLRHLGFIHDPAKIADKREAAKIKPSDMAMVGYVGAAAIIAQP